MKKVHSEHFFKNIDKLDLLILDELGYIPLHKQGAELLFQVISICYQRKSIIVTTNLQFSQWNNVFGDPILTEAVIDRLIHHSHLVLFQGESYRFRESMALKRCWKILRFGKCTFLMAIQCIFHLPKTINYIENTLKYDYNNGVLEGINNKIKVIKCKLAHYFRR